MPALNSLLAFPLHTPSLQDEGWSDGDWMSREPLITGGTRTGPVTGTSEPQQTLSHSGRTVSLLVYFKDFVTYE